MEDQDQGMDKSTADGKKERAALAFKRDEVADESEERAYWY